MFQFETIFSILEGIDPQLPALAWADSGTRAPHDPDRAGHRGVISYGKLLEICLNVDLFMDSIGCPRSSVIAVVASHSLETAALLIALPRSGRVCHPLNPQTASRKAIEFALKDVKATLLVVPPIDQGDCSDAIEVALSLGLPVVRAQPLQQDNLSALNLHAISQPGPDKLMNRVEGNGDNKSAYSAKPSDVAYLMHTSGTTSLPKLVPITHGALTANLKGTVSAYELTSSDSCLHILPFFHIAGIAIGLLPTLASGGCAVVPPVFDPLSFPQLLRRHNVTWFTAVPAIFKSLLSHQGGFASEDGSLKKLRFVRSGAAAMSIRDIERVVELFKVPFIDSYGMTETCGGVLSTLPGVTSFDGCIGTPIVENLEIKVCDEDGNEVDVGKQGEIYLRGPSVTPGYINNEDANKKAFTADGWFRTGDLGFLRYIENSMGVGSEYSSGPWLSLTGRIKEMINKGGEKVSPAEVEAVAMMEESLKLAVCFSMPDDTYGEQVAIAVVPKVHLEGEGRSLAYSVLSICREHLAPFQVPSVVYVLSSSELVPVTAARKVQRTVMLSVLEKAGIDPVVQVSKTDARILCSNPFEMARDEQERVTLEIWHQVLKLTGIGVLDDFYELGGTSILAGRIASLMEQRLGKPFTGATVLQKRRIRDLCGEANQSTQGSLVEAKSPVDYMHIISQSPAHILSSGQEQMLILHHHNPSSGFYNQPLVLAFYGSVDTTRLSSCIQALVRRHDILRTTYKIRESGSWLPSTMDPADEHIQLSQVDLTESEFDVTSVDFEKIVIQEYSKPFDLFNELPVRATLYKLRSCHVLMMTLHHIATDGWSMAVLQNDLAALYEAKGDENLLPTVEVNYAAYTRWQRALQTSETIQSQLKYWREKLKGIEPLLLPSDRPRPVVQKYNGGMHTFNIPNDILNRLRHLSQQHGTTLFMTTLAAFQVLMTKLSGISRFAIGSPASGRAHLSLERTLGYFVNPLAVSADLADNPSISSLLESVKNNTLEALKNAIVPFTEVVANSDCERSSSFTPIYQVMFVLQERALDRTRELGGGIEMKQHRLTSGVTAKFDLFMELISEDDDSMLGRIEYSSILFDPDTIQRWCNEYLWVLHEFCSDPSVPISQISIPKEEVDILRGFHGDLHRPGTLSCPLIHHAFQGIAAAHPSRPCLQFGDAVMSYGEVNEAANRVANRLISLGVGLGSVVGIMLERSFELVISILGALKSGAGYLPCDPDYPDDRLSIYLEDAKASVLLTQASHLDRSLNLVEESCRVVDTATLLTESSGSTSNPPANRCSPDGTAYIIFTSGSTGRPKGVLVAHRGVRDLMPWLTELHGLGPEDVVMFSNTISFDAHILQLMPPLTLGAKLVIAKPKGHMDPDYMVDLIQSAGITSMVFTVPTLATEYLASPILAAPNTKMKSWGLGGESVSMDTMRRIQEVFPNARIINTYGPTEVTAVCVHHTYAPDDEVVVIGKPDPNIHAYIVDSSMQLVPMGAPGELLLSGPRLALGYANRPDLTAEKFIPNPCLVTFESQIPDDLKPHFQLAYRTGDLVRWRANGEIEFLGRIDRQVKVNGVRIELGEVEAVLGAADGVQAAVVSAVRDPQGKQKLVGYVTPGVVDTDAVLEHCRSSLVASMVPSVIIALDSFPLLPNGKVDVRSLPAPEWEDSEETFIEPATELERVVASVWVEVLRRSEPLSALSDFFTAGGTSLQVFRVTAALQKAVGLEGLPPTLIHTSRTVRATALAIQGLLDGRSGDYIAKLPPIVRSEWGDSLRPLSSNQEQMWVLAQNGGSVAYNMLFVLQLDGLPDIDVLQQSLDEVARRHEVLRMHYFDVDGVPMGKIADMDAFRVPFEVIDFDSSECLADAIALEGRKEFNFFTGPLIRSQILKLKDGSDVKLIINMHHAIGDGWSWGLCFNEISAHFRRFSGQEFATVESLPIQYSDYAAWQSVLLSSELAGEAEVYWRNHLLGAPTFLQLPNDYLRPEKPSFKASTLSLIIPPELQSRISTCARQLGINVQAVLLSALQIVLMLYSRQNDLVVGVPVAGRDQAATQNLIGYFINTLPIRAIINMEDTFSQVANRASQTVIESLEHGFLPLARILQAAQVHRSANINPLFQVILQYLPKDQNLGTELKLGNVTGHVIPNPEGQAQAKMDMIFTLTEGGRFTAEYMAELFSPSTVQRLMDNLILCLQHVTTAPEAKASDIHVLCEDDLTLLRSFATPELRPGTLSCPLIHHAFEGIAAAHPGRPCLQFGDAVMSYGEVNEAANRVANRLISMSVGLGSVVGIMLERSFELVISILGALKSGAGYLPCDPDYPDDRLSIYLEDAKASVLLTQASHLDRSMSLVEESCRVVDTATLLTESSGSTSNPPANRCSPDGTAYIIFTSGSTGRPKGVLVAHRGVRDLMPWLTELHGLGPEDVVMFSNTISFDAHILQLMPPLTLGAKLVIAKPKGHMDPDYMADLIQSAGITSMVFTVPTLANEYLNSPVMDWPLQAMKSWGLGGESVSMDTMRRIQEVFPNARIINTYGPTEVTAVCVHHTYAPDDEVVVIGKPDPNIHAYIVDSSLQLVPVGAPGELLLSGPRLALGYANRSDLTSEKFIPNPCLVTFESQIPDNLKPHFQLAYRTGDLVRWRANGEIEFLGRIDRQVKVNGVRIELGEVEAVLGAADGVQAAVVSAVRDPQGKQKLVGYVTPDDVDTAAVLEHCRSRLVASMVPSVITAMESFPLLPNGKIDVRSLPSPEWEVDSEEAFVEPATELERMVASIWMEVLRRSEPLSALSDFFTAGGTSLQVFRVTAALQKALSLESLPSSLIHMSRTVRATASALQSLLDSRDSGKHSGLPPIVANKWEDGLRPLSSNQEQMWVLAQSGGSVAYNMPLVLQLDGVLNRDFLQQALNAVAHRHEVLRTRFELQDDGQVAGVVFDNDDFSVPLEVLSNVSEPDAKKRLEAEATIAFDLSKGPMIRAVLLIFESESAGSVLGLTLHHSVADAWSIGIINNELTHAYTAFAKGNTPLWEPLPIQYPDFALWQKELTSLEGHSILREYWKNSLAGCPTLLQLPMDRSRPESPTYAAGTVQHAFDAELMARLSALAKENSVNMQAVMLTGVQLLLMRYSAQDDLIIGVPAAGRDRPETHGVVGFFINTLPIRGTVNEDSSFEEMLRSVSQTVLKGMANSALPLQEIVQAVGAPRTKGANPLFQVLCQTLAASDLEGPQFDGMTCKALTDVRLAEAKFDLSFFFGEDGGLVVEYMTELFDKTTVEKMIESLTVLLAGCAASPNSPVLSLPMLSSTELDHVAMVGQGPIREDYLNAPLIHQLFEAQAAWNPSRPCLVYEATSLSYGEVNAKANTLARVLRKRGVEKESIVGIMLDRSPELIIAILATLKAGGGYLPMDPTYPEERLAIYAEDAKASMVLTQQQHAPTAQRLAGDAIVLVVDENVLSQDGSRDANEDTSQNLSAAYCDSEATSLVLFTSGSTGRPKGVQHAHRHLRELLLGTCNYFELNEEDVIILTNTICFDVHALQIFAPLAVGAKLILAKPGGHTDGDYICSLIWEHRVTGFIFTVPFLANEYLNSKVLQAPVPFMKHWGMGGDAVPLEIVHRMKAAFPAMVENSGPVNSYGPTEGNVVTQHRFPNDATGTPIGRPDDNIHCMVVDSAMHPVPIGVPGELLLSGPRLAVGYIGRPDLTAEKFVPNPCFDAMTRNLPEILKPHYRRAYRTGDLVRWRSDGNLEYLGRIDRQVKISGVRVELGEVEAALASSPEVIKAVAAAVADEHGVKRLVGYVTPEDADPSAVLSHCVGRLMAAMVPSVVVPLPAFPLLPNGKVDVRSLPVPDWSSMGGSEEYLAPANDVERAVQAVFADILGRPAEELSVLTDFFAAGGTSLQVFRVTAALQKALGLDGLPSSLVHNARTVQATAAALQELIESDSPVEKLPPLTARVWSDPTRPLSPSQEVYWYNAKLRGAGANNMPVTLEFSGRLSVPHLQKALDAVAARHEILRMHYIEPSPNKPMAYITPVEEFSTPIRKKLVSQDDLKTAVVADLSEKFELDKGPLLRCSILEDEKDPDFSILIVNMHHTLGDGWSMAVLARELAEAYNASLEGRNWSPEKLPISYFDYAAWQRDYLAAGALQERLQHWQQKFSGLPETPAVIPDFEKTQNFKGLGDSVRLDFDPSLTRALIAFAKRNGLNMQALMLRACELAMHNYTGRDDFIFIIPMALRNQIETHNLIGFLINAVPVRHKIKQDEDTVAAARALGREVQESLAKNLPHGFIVRNIDGLRPHLQLMFQYINVSEVSASTSFGQLESRQLRSELVRLTHAKTEIFFHLSNTGMAVEYYTELFDRSKMEKLANLVLASLKEAAGVA